MAKTLTQEQTEDIISLLKQRFEANPERHRRLVWDEIEKRLRAKPERLYSLHRMEETGGEPDVILYDSASDEYVICDCSEQSPVGRRNTCFDEEARIKRKKAPPERSAVGMAEEMGISILTEEQYRKLQELGEFDTKSSSWIATPEKIRKLGGAVFCDRRYDTVFLYHNGADSYYSSRGFRGTFRI